VLQNFLPSLPQIIAFAIILFTCFPVHEFAHAWTANYFGDDTPRLNGRLTLNPLAHLDPLGSLMMIVAGFGWAKPVPINPYILNRRSPAATMLVSLAGPMSNLLMAILASIPFRLKLVSVADISQSSGSTFPTFAWFLFTFITINLFLMLFNLLPLFPLDGEKVLEYFLPRSGARVLESIRPYGPLIFIAVIFILPRLIGIDLIGRLIQLVLIPIVRVLIGA
jgi:Zn-dependent protease